MRRILHVMMAAGMCFALAMSAQTPAVPAPKHEANFDAERAQADQMFLAGKKLESLPLYEDLCRQDQTIAVFAERHAQGLIAKAATMSEGPEKQAAQNLGVSELLRAQKLGDNSPLVQNLVSMLAKSPVGAIVTGVPLTVGYTYNGKPEAQAAMAEAQAAFSAQNLEGALKAYKRAAELDPAWYSADLFVGDTYFAMKNYAEAGPWFAKAIAIDPDRDTAWRYWGDALFKATDVIGAKAKYEQAVVAEPYSKPAWNALQQWVTVTKVQLARFQITKPNYQTLNGVLQVDPALANEMGDGRASWLVYEKARVAHGGLTPNQAIVAGATMADGTFKENGYRHSLKEETECLHAMLADVQAKMKAGTVTEEKLDPSIKNLMRLDKDGMIESWVLLSGADAGIRYDYPVYRNAHRELLLAYVDKYVLARAGN